MGGPFYGSFCGGCVVFMGVLSVLTLYVVGVDLLCEFFRGDIRW